MSTIESLLHLFYTNVDKSIAVAYFTLLNIVGCVKRTRVNCEYSGNVHRVYTQKET